MKEIRVDNWTPQEEQLLVETLLNYVRHGKTQLQAFQDVGEQIDRGSSACGFRWNTYLRKKFNEELRIAKRERRGQKIGLSKFEKPVIEKQVEVEVVTQNIHIPVENLAIKEFKGQRVVTFKDIDEVHGRPDGTARRNFNQNKNHLIEGEDYFERNPSEAAKEFGIIAPNGIKLLTESGYLMLVKSFTDDLAWEVQRKLVKMYFRVKETVKAEAPMLPTSFAEALRLAADLEEKNERLKLENQQKQVEILMLEQQIAEDEPKISYYDTILQSTDTLIVSQIAEDYGLTAQALNKILHKEQVQYKLNGQWLLYSEHKGKGYTESKTIKFDKPSGEAGISLQTRWTQKGRLFIHGILTDLGIIPLMDREEKEA